MTWDSGLGLRNRRLRLRAMSRETKATEIGVIPGKSQKYPCNNQKMAYTVRIAAGTVKYQYFKDVYFLEGD